MTTDEIHTAAALALADVWSEQFQRSLPGIRAEDMAAAGWTVPALEHVIALSDHALEAGSATAARCDAVARGRYARYTGAERTPETEAKRRNLRRRLLTGDLLRSAVSLVGDGGFPVSQALGWLAVLAVRADKTVVASVDEIAPLVPFAGRRSTTLLDQWSAGVPEDLVPLAWAAGLTPTEAAERHRGNTLTVTSLMMLARLRGFPLTEAISAVDRPIDDGGAR